jgi:hypothetical protein
MHACGLRATFRKLTDEENFFSVAFLEYLFYKTGVAEILHRDASESRRLAAQLGPLTVGTDDQSRLEETTAVLNVASTYLPYYCDRG